MPYFFTKSGFRVNILIYNDLKNITVWNNIPGISIYSLRFTIISIADLITILKVEKIRLYRFFTFLSRDLTAKMPLEYIEVYRYYLCLAIGYNPLISSISFTILIKTYLPIAIEYKALS